MSKAKKPEVKKVEEFNVSLTAVDINNIMLALNKLVSTSANNDMTGNSQVRLFIESKFSKAMKK